MTFDQFISYLWNAGWRDPLDAQHTEIRKVWDDLCQRGMNIPFPAKPE